MKRLSVLASAVAFSMLLVANVYGQGAAPAQVAGTNVAVIDVAYIFKHHAAFKAQMERLKADVMQAEEALKSKTASIKQMAEQLKQVEAGSPQYKQVEAELFKAQGDLQTEASLKKKDLLDRESKAYYVVYREIDAAVKQFSQTYRIGLVLRFNGDPIDPNDRQEIMKGISKPVVYYNPELDITKPILDGLNAAAAAAPGIEAQR